VAIIALIVLIARYRLNPFIVITLISLGLALVAGMPPSAVVGAYEAGVGKTLGHIALVVALGTMLGKMMAESGGAEQMARTLIDRFGEKNAHWAMVCIAFLVGLPLMLAGCASTVPQYTNYAALPNEQFPLKAVPAEKIKPELRRQEVAYETAHPAGTVIVDTPARRAYYVLGNGRAIRYGVGVGRAGLALPAAPMSAARPNGRPGRQRSTCNAGKLATGSSPAACRAARTIRSVRAPYISIAAATTRISASMAPTSRNRSALPCRAAASA